MGMELSGYKLPEELHDVCDGDDSRASLDGHAGYESHVSQDGQDSQDSWDSRN